MTQKEQSSRMAVLLFTDIVDSVGLQARVGTGAYSRLLRLHHKLFQEVLRTVGAGTIHQDTGDGFLAEFITAADAVNAALLFQMSLRDADWDSEAPQARIGINQGQLAEIRLDPDSPGKIVGMPVNIAARVMGVARGGQILMTRSVYDDARHFVREHPVADSSGSSPRAIEWKAHGTYSFKGADEPIQIFEVGAVGLAPMAAPLDSEKGRQTKPGKRERARLPRASIGAGLTALCGLALLTRLGDGWTHASYDYLFRFGGRAVTNKVVIVFMDNEAYDELHQTRGQPWDRGLHARFLNKLADDGCPLVVLDTFFEKTNSPAPDAALAAALKRQKRVALGARQAEGTHPDLESARPTPPIEPFLSAANNAWGVAWLDPELDRIVRQHWPFPAPGPYLSLPWTAARLAGARLDDTPRRQWLRYYGPQRPWKSLSYHFALDQTTNYFRDKIVFIGNKPQTSFYDRETDEFQTPFVRWTGESSGGVEILATQFLNLVNGDWLRRAAWWTEALALILSGGLLGVALSRLRPLAASGVAAGVALTVAVAAILLSYFSNYWFPWLAIAGGQVPCALAWAIFAPGLPGAAQTRHTGTVVLAPGQGTRLSPGPVSFPNIPNYRRFHLLGKGGFGEVWLVRSAIGQWQALKLVSQAGKERGAYEAEFEGIRKYKPVSEMHSGLLRVELVSEKKPEGYFYYVMELADSQSSGWESLPASYKPMSLETRRSQANGRRLPVSECVRIGIALTEALDFLHHHGLTHRDIKPSNIIFVKGVPKLADVGLVTEIRPPDQIKTHLGPPDYMPPPGQLPGTAQGDIYSLGMVLYVISTGRDPGSFPELSATLLEQAGPDDFVPLNGIILKACQKRPADRYPSAAAMRDALLEAQQELGGPGPVRGQAPTG